MRVLVHQRDDARSDMKQRDQCAQTRTSQSLACLACVWRTFQHCDVRACVSRRQARSERQLWRHSRRLPQFRPPCIRSALVYKQSADAERLNVANFHQHAFVATLNSPVRDVCNVSAPPFTVRQAKIRCTRRLCDQAVQDWRTTCSKAGVELRNSSIDCNRAADLLELFKAHRHAQPLL